MATQTSNDNGSGGAHASAVSTQLRSIPLSRIVVEEGFNPRGELLEDDALCQLAETMRQRGCLQPVLVRELPNGGFKLIAGERRYRAAALAALTEIPAKVTTEESVDLVDAMI